MTIMFFGNIFNFIHLAHFEKQSYFKKDKVESEVGEISESHDHDDEVTSSPMMSSYINAIRQQSAK